MKMQLVIKKGNDVFNKRMYRERAGFIPILNPFGILKDIR